MQSPVSNVSVMFLLRKRNDDKVPIFPDQIDAQLLILSIVPQTEDLDPAEQEETVLNPDIGRPVGKEVSDVFYSVVGRDLRKRRRLSHALNGLVVRRIHVEESPLCPEESSLCPEDDLSNVDGEIRRKKEMFLFHKLPWPVVSNKLLSLRQGRAVMIRRLQELDLSVSPSQPDTPKDGNCMMSSILDQLRFDLYQKSFAKSPQQLR